MFVIGSNMVNQWLRKYLKPCPLGSLIRWVTYKAEYILSLMEKPKLKHGLLETLARFETLEICLLPPLSSQLYTKLNAHILAYDEQKLK